MRCLVVVLVVIFANIAVAQEPSPTDEAQVQMRVEAISKTLRCVVCQNQSIYDSSAPLAADMRRLVEKRVRAGDSDAEVRDHLSHAYGDFVLMRPPVETRTWLLWFGPGLLVVLGLTGLWLSARRRQGATDPDAVISADDQARIDAALGRSRNEDKT